MPEITDSALPPPPNAEPQDGDGLLAGVGDALPPPAPSAWAGVEARASALIEQATGKTVSGHLMEALSARPGAQMLAIGGSAGGVAVELMRHAPDAALACIDSRPKWLEAGRQRARDLALDAQFAALDLETIELEPRAFDLVFCHAALYRVVELEALADQIGRALRPQGRLVVVDVVTRNGHAMWRETREVVQAIWKTLPVRFRLNHTAYTAPLIDDVIWEPGPVPSGVKSARPEDILPVLGQRFLAEHFVPYFSLSRRFFDSMYGPNYDLAAPLDSALFNWIWELDLHYLATKRLRPETFFGIYRAA